MRIVHITTVHKPFDNRIYFKECQSLHEAGHSVSLMVSGVESDTTKSVDIIGLPKYANRKQNFFEVSIKAVYKKAKEINADVYHFHDPELLVVGLILKLKGYKVIYDVHENNPASLMSKPYLPNRFKAKTISLLFDGFERFAASFMSGIVTATDDIAQRFKSKIPVVLRNFPILPDFSQIEIPKIEKPKPVVIFVGGMTKIRGIKELINAFEQIDNAELWLLGPFESDEFQQECEQLPGWKNTRYLGKVDAKAIYGYIKLADIGVVTYLPFPNHVTALPTKPFEYMAGGLPMIMSHFPYWKELFNGSAEFVDPANSNEIANTIKKMISDQNGLEKMGNTNKQLTQTEYNWSIEKNRLLDLYSKLDKKPGLN